MKRVVFAVCLMMMAIMSKAAFLENVPVAIKQPDGVVLECYASGDEFYNYLHDINGFTIIQDHSTGFYVYADLKDGELVPTDLIAGRSEPASKLKPFLNISPERRMAMRKAWEVPEDLWEPEVRTDGTNHGTLNNIVIFIRFADDDEFTNTFSSVNNMFNVNSNGVSMQSYFDEVSYHQINIPTTFYPAPNGEQIISYQDSHNRGYFQEYDATTNPIGYQGGNSGSERTQREHELLRDAVNYINENNMIPAGLNVDYDNNGRVDNVCFIVRGTPGAWSSLLWPHQWYLYSYNVKINGKRVYTFNFQLADAGEHHFSTSTMCHEMNHSLGAPDLYHYYYGDDLQPVGKWDLMENNSTPPQHMGAYMKYRYGNWIDEIPEITEAGVYTLHDVSSSTNNCYKMASSANNQYFVFEYRRKSVEAAVPGSGLLIYRINTDSDGEGNQDYDGASVFDEVYIYRPNGSPASNGSINSAFFSAGSGRTAFDATTNPYPYLIDGTVYDGVVVSEISAAGETISFRIGTLCDAPTHLTASLIYSEVTLSWDEVEDVESYSVYRNNTLINGSVATNSFTDNLPVCGHYSYYVKSNCPAGGNSMASNVVEVNYTYPGPIATNLTGDVNGDQVELSWTEPEIRANTLYYGTASNYHTSHHHWAQIYDYSKLGDCFGMAVEKIQFRTYTTGIDYTMKLYNGDEPVDANLLATKSFTPTSSWVWLDVALDPPAYIDCTKKLWVTFYCDSNSAVTMGPYDGDDYENAILLSDDGVDYYVPSWSGGGSYSAAVKVFLATGSYTYNIFNDDVMIAQNKSGSSYSYTEVNEGFHEYHVTTNYYGGESQASNSVSVPASATRQFLGTSNADWAMASNWKNNTLPTASDNVWIKNDAVLNTDFAVGGLYISEDASLVVSPNKVFSIAGDVENLAGTYGIVVESGAALVTNATNLQGTAKRVMTDAEKDTWTGDWHFLSSPMVGVPVSDFTSLAINDNCDLYLYNEPDSYWYNEKDDDRSLSNSFYTVNGNNFTPGRGYLTSFGSAATMSFKGVFNAGEIDIPVTVSSSALNGFNLIGNPYPCSIDWDAASGWSRSALGDNPYFYIYDDAIGQYRTYSASTGGTPVGTNGIIAPNQAFFVKAVSIGSVIVNDGAKTISTGSFRKENERDLVRILVSGENGSDELLICELEEKQMSAEKMFSPDADMPSLYIRHDDTNISIFVCDAKEAGRPITMAFRSGKVGRFVLSSNADVELTDLITGAVTDLSKHDYVFEATPSDSAERFVVRLKRENF